MRRRHLRWCRHHRRLAPAQQLALTPGLRTNALDRGPPLHCCSLVPGFYIVTYGMGIYNLNLVLGFITPQFDPEQEAGPELPTKADEEFRPFVRRLPEFKFW